ncbi:hypothetical protein C8R45DRAFT_1105454 [Mycena sanguinolenta]|nr:hypothetical protein C8R45DRAFT_1105454 [Mycena sanguinolenta]
MNCEFSLSILLYIPQLLAHTPQLLESLFNKAGGPKLARSLLAHRPAHIGFPSGSFTEAVIPSDVLGTYAGRWLVEYGQSTQPDAPGDPDSGCGLLPFTTMKKEFGRTWEVVRA